MQALYEKLERETGYKLESIHLLYNSHFRRQMKLWAVLMIVIFLALITTTWSTQSYGQSEALKPDSSNFSTDESEKKHFIRISVSTGNNIIQNGRKWQVIRFIFSPL